MSPDEVLVDVAGLDRELRVVPYYGERAVFYNPGGAAPLGIILASVKERDGPNDRRALLDRPGVFRFAFGMTEAGFRHQFGDRPARPPKGGVVDLAGYDLTRLDSLVPHPVYAWMGWVQILSPTRSSFSSLLPLVEESLEHVKERWESRG